MLPWVLAGIATVVCLAFAAFTGHMWEDYFITFRSSLNLATGNGLVFQPGERVHTFTSPLGTLLPALFALGGGDDVVIRALWLFRIVSALAVGGAVWLAARAMQRHNVAPFIIAVVGGGWAIDAKVIDFSINGMETALVVLFVTFTWHAFASGARLGPCAVAFAGLQWTRPDGFVFFGAIALAWVLVGAANFGLSWRDRIWAVIRPIAAGGVLYLPWFVFAWVYYGTPIPHTILAKARPHSPVETIQLLASYPWRLLFGAATSHDIFKPAYYFLGGWPDFLNVIARGLATGASLAWVWPRLAPSGRIASLSFFLGGFYIIYIPPSPWYYPGWQALALISWGYLLHALWSIRITSTSTRGLVQASTRLAGVFILLVQAGIFVCVAWQMRVQQRLIETGHRREIGLWLGAHAVSPRDTVFLECLGYIGYFSRLKMLDYPGLSSPEVVAVRRAGHNGFAQALAALKPTWLVLRPLEADDVFKSYPELEAEYTLRRRFDVREQVDAHPLLPGRNYLYFDAAFLVYQRKAAGDDL